MRKTTQKLFQAQQSIYQGRVVILFALLHTLVFSAFFVLWSWWGVILGFFTNCVLDAIAFFVWHCKSNRNIKDNSNDGDILHLNSCKRTHQGQQSPPNTPHSCKNPMEMWRLVHTHVDYFIKLQNTNAKIDYINHLCRLGGESAEYRRLVFHALQEINAYLEDNLLSMP